MKNRDKLPYNAVTGKSFYDGEEFPVWYNPVIPNGVKIYEDIDCTVEAKKPYENFKAYYIKGDLSHELGIKVDGVKYPNPSTPIEWIPSRYGVIQLYTKILWDYTMPTKVKIYDDVDCTIIAQKPYLVGQTYYVKCENLAYNEYLEIDGVKIEDCTNATEFIPNIDSSIRIRKRLEWNNNPLPNGVGIYDDKAGHITATKPYLVGKPYYIRCSNLVNKGVEIDGVKIEDCSTGIEFIPSIHSEIRLYDFKTWNGIFNDTSGLIVKVYKYGDLVNEVNPPYLVGRKYVLEVNNTLSKDITIMIDNTFYIVPKTTTKYYDFIPRDDLVISIDCNLPVSTGGGEIIGGETVRQIKYFSSETISNSSGWQLYLKHNMTFKDINKVKVDVIWSTPILHPTRNIIMDVSYSRINETTVAFAINSFNIVFPPDNETITFGFYITEYN